MTWRSALYRFLRVSNDVRAIIRGPKAIAKRAGRRVYGKATGRLAGRIFG